MRAWQAGGRRAEGEGKRDTVCTCRGRIEKREKSDTRSNVKI